MDQDGYLHPGIIEFPVPILKADPAAIKDIREKLYEAELPGLIRVDFSDLAQGCKTYDEFIEKNVRYLSGNTVILRDWNLRAEKEGK